MTLPILIAGLILRFADNPQWFNGAYTIGDICIWVGAVGIALTLLIFVFVGSVGLFSVFKR